ncbi:universal stress protein [Pseudonocardia sp. H11422]|uniref:universal stress protein n=1 Tax=Pseudonocardia sp. H11422 TaxID=2835866 RepID=UPI001BDCC3CC|nr:universal stress protein [Pseudonocardia sp. H11422]
MDERQRAQDLAGVVVGVDGTQLGLRAVGWAAAEARLRGLPLRIVHAAPYAGDPAGPGRRRATTILARAYTVAHQREPSITVHTEQHDGAPGRALVELSAQAQLLVVGMGDGERPEEVLTGSTALTVTGQAHCPVVVVRGHRRAPTSGRAVLAGVDDPPTDVAVLSVAFNDVRRHRTPLVVLHSLHGAGPLRDHLLGHDEQAHDRAVQRMGEALAPWRAAFPEVPVELRVIRGQPVEHLLETGVGVRLMVVGTRGRGAPVRAVFGSTTREVLRRSPCPVEVVRPDVTVADSGTRPAAVAAPEHASVAATGRAAYLSHPHDLRQPW